jgi:hypothetical protein
MSSSSTNTMLMFFDICGTVHREFTPQGQTSTQSFTAKFCSVWGRTFGESDWICGARRIGFSTMTMHPVSEHSSFKSFSPTTTCHRFHTRPTRQI